MNAVQEISEAIIHAYKAISGPQRRQQEHSRRIAQYSPLMEKATDEFFDLIKTEVSRGTRHMPRGTPAEIAKKIADWKYIEREGWKIMVKPHLTIVVAGAEMMLDSAIQKQRTDPIGDQAVWWADEHAAELVTYISAGTMAYIREMVSQGVREGQSLQQIAPNIRNYIGLNERQTTALNRLHLKMMNRGMSVNEMQPILDKYKFKALRYRAMMISRTETAFALSGGTLNAYGEMGIKYVEWNADPMACPICEAQNGTVHKIEEAYALIPAHPNCECVWIMSLKGPYGKKPARRTPGARPRDNRENFHRAVTDEEKYYIRQWTGMHYRLFRDYLMESPAQRADWLSGLGEEGKRIKKGAEALEKMFIKYKDGAKAKTLYRGVSSLDDETYGYLKAFQKGQTIQVDEAMTSWSTERKIAEEFSAMRGDVNNVVFELKAGRKATQELDIWKYSSQGEAEKEVLMNTKNFKVSSIKETKVTRTVPDPGMGGEFDVEYSYLHVVLEEIK